MSQRLERKLSLLDRTNLRLHVTQCRDCTNFARQLPEIGKAVRAFASHDPDSKDIK
ncbi:zf-HC2 domain-containing protein [Parasphingorhabdus sp.]|uniref:zf-HC2 domain-containing protein n=1 Tax=Parasphingorhabdus sp. TaxID=2709688 RepID=UPI0035932EEE